MKKILFLFGILVFFCCSSLANGCKSCEKMPSYDIFEPKSGYEEKNEKNSPCTQDNSKNIEKFCQDSQIDDDEYFTYNLCFFDRQYRSLKRRLCLTKRQEKSIDNIYRNFKADMENLYFKYQNKRDCLLANLDCNCNANKENKRELKEYKKEAKEKYSDFCYEIKELLCKKQRKEFKLFQKEERRKIAKIKKYCIIYKFPCEKCCQN